MNKILTLYDIEFKRIKKIYLSILGILVLGNLGYMIFSLFYVTKEVEKSLIIKGGLSLLRSNEAFKILQNGNIIYDIYGSTFFMMFLAILWCLYYALSIWYKDIYSKTKVAYTLFMLPCNKFIVYLSKLLTVVALIYGVIATQHLLWIMEMLILKGFAGIELNQMVEMINYSNSASFLLSGVSIYPLEFLILYIIGPILIVTVLFTAVIIHKSLNKLGAFIGVIYIMAIIFIYIYTYGTYILFSDELLKYNLIYELLVFLASINLSYVLLNKRVYV